MRCYGDWSQTPSACVRCPACGYPTLAVECPDCEVVRTKRPEAGKPWWVVLWLAGVATSVVLAGLSPNGSPARIGLAFAAGVLFLVGFTIGLLTLGWASNRLESRREEWAKPMPGSPVRHQRDVMVTLNSLGSSYHALDAAEVDLREVLAQQSSQLEVALLAVKLERWAGWVRAVAVQAPYRAPEALAVALGNNVGHEAAIREGCVDALRSAVCEVAARAEVELGLPL